ncbi:MAG: ABC transporter ATP-binding protein [Candidatus Thiodiazotropha sp. (ex Epidulcina cf. delphinae)]|nr:ABC transporter ATP-binding protein [Candidatus Thiodiazotropha sp. (ex Epidulcina cf. delphinae)]
MASIVFDHVSKTYSDGADVIRQLHLAVENGELLVLVGPSGCGKSTALRMVAGLEEISAGEIRIDGRVVNDIPPQRRNLAMVFQNYALYPHMTVRRNLEFPLRMRKLAGAEITRRAEKIAEMLDLTALLERKPKALSGGQRQRVAMGRAIVRDADAFLMDEPLSNLDAKLRVQIRTEIASLQARLDVTTLYVTHDQVEAMTLGQRVAVIREGRLQQVAPPWEIYRQPANIFVAGFIGSPGMNVLRGTLEAVDGNPVIDLGPTRLSLPKQTLVDHPGLQADLGQALLIGIRPEAIHLADNLTKDVLPAQAHAVESLGHETILHVTTGLTTIPCDTINPAASATPAPPLIAVLPGRHTFRPGDSLRLDIDGNGLCFFDMSGNAVR